MEILLADEVELLRSHDSSALTDQVERQVNRLRSLSYADRADRADRADALEIRK